MIVGANNNLLGLINNPLATSVFLILVAALMTLFRENVIFEFFTCSFNVLISYNINNLLLYLKGISLTQKGY